MTLRWTPLAPFGVEIEADLRRPIPDRDAEQLRELFGAHHLIVARGQELSRTEQERFTGLFGPVLADQRATEFVSNDASAGAFGAHRLSSHSDLAFLPEPILVAALLATDVVDGASSTRFASGALTYRELPAELRERIDGRETLNVLPVDQTRRTRLHEIRPEDPRAVHPAVMRCRYSGEPFLYLSEQHVDSVVGMDADESEALLQQLLGYLLDPARVLVHTWVRGDIVLWDNFVVFHGRDEVPVETVGTRTFQRSSAGTKSFVEQTSEYYVDRSTGLLTRTAS